MPPKSANSGIRQLSSGESVIPSSVRADGTVRKEIRVKAGYKPPEDVEVYKNRTAEAWKNRGKGGVPGAQVVGAEDQAANGSGAANKNAKRREARKKAAAAGVAEGEAGEAKADGNGDVVNGGIVEAKQETNDPEAEKAKEGRKLAKKLRQARELQEKKENGDELLPEQLAKVVKMNELIRQLNSLGFDAEGEKKAAEGEPASDG